MKILKLFEFFVVGKATSKFTVLSFIFYFLRNRKKMLAIFQ